MIPIGIEVKSEIGSKLTGFRKIWWNGKEPVALSSARYFLRVSKLWVRRCSSRRFSLRSPIFILFTSSPQCEATTGQDCSRNTPEAKLKRQRQGTEGYNNRPPEKDCPESLLRHHCLSPIGIAQGESQCYACDKTSQMGGIIGPQK